jgi:glycosyltransferase involved in cell wall biosynthesis
MTVLGSDTTYIGSTTLALLLDPERPKHRDLPRGLTSVLRVRNEALSLPWSLPPMLRASDHVILVDNDSTDGSADVARRVAAEVGGAGLTVLDFPYAVSRCGPEHLSTPPDSVHSLAYLNNWAFSHARTSYALKWDGDMVLTPEGERMLADFAWQIGHDSWNLKLPRHPLYVESDQVAYLDLGLHNVEHYGHPVSPDFSYVKAFEWEFLVFPEGTRNFVLPAGVCVELKALDQSEFAHWTSAEAFETSPRTRRKRREYAVFNAILAGQADGLDNVHRIEAPPGRHVVDYVTRDWLPAAPRPLVHDPAAH